MTRKRLLGFAGAAAIGLAVTVTAIYVAPSDLAAQTAEVVAATPAFFGGRHGGWRGHHGGRGMARLCSDARDEGLNRAISFVEGIMAFTPPQEEAWAKLAASLRAGSDSIGEACGDMRAAGRPDTAPERLARLASMMTTGVSILDQVRPDFDAFYATLSEKQQKALDDLMQHRGRRS